jgi:hypothetical protein
MDLLRPLMDRFGPRIKVKDGSILPKRCAICNEPVSDPPKRFVLRWDPHGGVNAHLGLIGLAIAHFTSKRGAVFVHFCPWHAKRRYLVMAIGGGVAAVGWGIVELFSGDPYWVIPGYVLIPVGVVLAVAALVGNLYFRAVRIDGDTMEIKGFGRKFREALKPEEIVEMPELTYAAQKNRGK